MRKLILLVNVDYIGFGCNRAFCEKIENNVYDDLKDFQEKEKTNLIPIELTDYMDLINNDEVKSENYFITYINFKNGPAKKRN